MSQQTKNRILTALSWSPLIAGVCAALFFLLPTGGSGSGSPRARPNTTLASHSTAPSLVAKQLPPGVATRDIDDLHVGDRVFASNPEISDEERGSWQEPEWSNWRRLKLEMDMPGNGVLHIDMLRPVEWLVEVDVIPGKLIYLEIPEMGAEGLAGVLSVDEGPVIPSGRGQVITATFSHPPSTAVLDVRSEGESSSIGVTDNHLFWSVDRQQFISIGKMLLGERVQTHQGETKRIVSKLARPGPELVYNLEVYGEHVYFVGPEGILAHNGYVNDLGVAAESKVAAKLKSEGWEVLGGIQNRSGHGIDMVARKKLNKTHYEYRVIEVKANTATLSSDQAMGGKKFAASRLERSKQWELSNEGFAAQKALQSAIDDPVKSTITYEVARVKLELNADTNRFNMVGPIEFSPWKKK